MRAHRPLVSLASAAAGLALTPVLEYAWHAWIAHGKRADVTREAHLEHHRTASEVVEPWTEMRENAGRVAGTLLAVNGLLAPAIGLACSVPLTAGLAAGYVATTLYHARMHRRPPRGRYEEWMWRFHWHHHAANARVNFGLTNPVLDFVFKSAVVPERVDLPEKLAPQWLRDQPDAAPGIRIRTPAIA
jgi:sterol desaturase/sphingolipid hydroxylase (fatty acid hydroxylase superfamily)